MVWKIKTIEPTTVIDITGNVKMTGYNTLEIKCDEVDARDGIMIFYNWEEDDPSLGSQKVNVIAMFPIRNLISVIKEESDGQTSETTVQ